MTIIEAMKKTVNEDGDIVIPVGATRGERDFSGVVTEVWLRETFGDQLDQTIPLTESQFDTLKNAVDGQWQDNWQWYRENAIIIVN
ncbi:hypothetical protein EV294_11259 [Paenibacillus sp. BK033]|uniref:hypothetical protein n=1 Tax=Paenibacillus sp. BK033 TaxID=2512133 RepID=UPI0010497597|nr:hypothetical protein [Paenibacillus sp. BK033]TCM89594.1 hypothetical protein EV294_11259 [Paenibacillus sp. BK033]